MLKEMKTGHYHSQNFYEINICWEAFTQSTVFMHEDDRDGNASFSVRKWEEFSQCRRGDVFLDAPMVVVNRTETRGPGGSHR